MKPSHLLTGPLPLPVVVARLGGNGPDGECRLGLPHAAITARVSVLVGWTRYFGLAVLTVTAQTCPAHATWYLRGQAAGHHRIWRVWHTTAGIRLDESTTTIGQARALVDEHWAQILGDEVRRR